MNFQTKHFEQILNGLAENGYAISDGFLSDAEVTVILETDEFRNYKASFVKAGVGDRQKKQINEGVRGDLIHWIDEETAVSEIKVFLKRLRDLMQYLNENLFLSLKDFEIHMTIYPPGASYQRHIDQFKNSDHRKLSVILYLNEEWKEEHGGQLRMHLPEGAKDFLPLAGRLVCFRSDQIEHEVLPATRARLSLTGWMLDQWVNLKHL